MRRIWFKAKRYGWGWYPATWQGWLVILMYIALVALGATALDDASGNLTAAYLLLVTLATSSLILISYKKGEKPGWRWGDKDGD